LQASAATRSAGTSSTERNCPACEWLAPSSSRAEERAAKRSPPSARAAAAIASASSAASAPSRIAVAGMTKKSGTLKPAALSRASAAPLPPATPTAPADAESRIVFTQ
jgi:hypothetical protein